MKALKNLLLGLFSAGMLAIAYVLLGILQLFAFLAGMDAWLGIGSILSLLIFLVIFFGTGPLGGLFIAVVGFYGAMAGWGWAWWQAALLCFPFVCLSLALLATAGVSSFLLFRKPTPGTRRI